MKLKRSHLSSLEGMKCKFLAPNFSPPGDHKTSKYPGGPQFLLKTFP